MIAASRIAPGNTTNTKLGSFRRAIRWAGQCKTNVSSSPLDRGILRKHFFSFGGEASSLPAGDQKGDRCNSQAPDVGLGPWSVLACVRQSWPAMSPDQPIQIAQKKKANNRNEAGMGNMAICISPKISDIPPVCIHANPTRCVLKEWFP